MPLTVALTGATGFIGSAVAGRLDAEGWHVKALIRSSSDPTRLSGISTEQVIGTLEDRDTLVRLVQGVDAVVHCAGAVRGLTQADFDRVNVRGVEHLLQAIRCCHSSPRFVLISSLAAREPALSFYAASKREAELVLEAGGKSLPWVSLRPPAVYGPGDRELLPLFRWMARGLAPVLGSRDARFSLLYVADLAEAVVKWLDSPSIHSGMFELADGQPGGYTWRDVIDTIARLQGRRVFPVTIPSWLLNVMAVSNLLVAKISGARPMLTPGKVRELRHLNWVGDNSALRDVINWNPRVSLEEGLRWTLGSVHGLPFFQTGIS